MMNSFFDKMGEKLMPFASKVSANRYLNAIKEGFFGVMPVIIVGSLFLLFTSIPINDNLPKALYLDDSSKDNNKC